MPGFQSFFRFFASFVLAKLATISIRVKRCSQSTLENFLKMPSLISLQNKALNIKEFLGSSNKYSRTGKSHLHLVRLDKIWVI